VICLDEINGTGCVYHFLVCRGVMDDVSKSSGAVVFVSMGVKRLILS